MSGPLVSKVRALLARAVDAGASQEEQRTSAWIAARLIHQHSLLEPEDQPAPACQAPEPRTHAAEPHRRVIRSRYAGYCRACGARYSVGARIAWARQAGAVCVSCHMGRAAA